MHSIPWWSPLWSSLMVMDKIACYHQAKRLWPELDRTTADEIQSNFAIHKSSEMCSFVLPKQEPGPQGWTGDYPPRVLQYNSDTERHKM